MTSCDLDGVMAVEAASFTQPYSRDVFERFVSRSSELDSGCWSSVAVPVAVDERASGSGAPASVVCGYCLCESLGSSVRVISLGTAAMYRGQGVGSLLLRHCLTCARECGASSVSLHVAVDNAAAIGLYKRMGFTALRKLTAYYREVGGDIDAWEMECALS